MTFIKGLSITSIAAAMCITAGAAGQGDCPAGTIADCVDSDCVDETWVADTFCDGTAQQYGADLCCYPAPGGNDGGDCTDDECAGAVCGDGTCSPGEDYINCAADCPAPVCGDGACTADETFDTCPDDCVDNGQCLPGEIVDCDGTGECWPANWVADTFCDGSAQQYGADLCCYPAPGGNDGGDCTADECAPPANACCTDAGCQELTADECAAAGGTFNAGVLCAAFPCGFLENCGDANTNQQPCTEPSTDGTTGCADGLCCSTVCLIDSICCEDGGEWDSVCVGYADTACGIGGCQPGEVVDCDGSGECWPETWVADGLCDGTAQAFEADLCCYPEEGGNDGGDCTEDECAAIECGDGICVLGVEDPTTCPEDCGDGALCPTVTTSSGDQDFDADGTIDACFTDPTTAVDTGYITLTWEGNCIAESVEFSGLGTLTGSYSSPLLVFGLGANQECYDITLTFLGGATSDVVNGCHSCGEPPVCGDGACNGDETFETCPDDCLPPGECPAGQILDCADNDCHPAEWVGDTFCDGNDQEFGADLCCFDGGVPGSFDGGDCTADDCSGGSGPVCGDGVCDTGEDEASCPEDCVVVVECPYDLTGDLVIGGGDLTVLLAAWGTADSPADFNGDGDVSGGDLTLLLASWGVVCE